VTILYLILPPWVALPVLAGSFLRVIVILYFLGYYIHVDEIRGITIFELKGGCLLFQLDMRDPHLGAPLFVRLRVERVRDGLHTQSVLVVIGLKSAKRELRFTVQIGY
jgi:hypothetical protein